MTRKRDPVGYAGQPPHARWPSGKRIALQFVVNYEEGAESSVEHGDDRSETLNSDNIGAVARQGRRDYVTESHYDYGSRAGYWRLMELFETRNVPITVFAVAEALAKNDAIRSHLSASPHEVCCHGLRWVDYADVPPDVEAAHMDRALVDLRDMTGKPVVGWYTGRISAKTRSLAAARDDLLYDSDAYDDDLPYWVSEHGTPWLVVPYTFDCNDMRFSLSPGFNTPGQFLDHLRYTFDALYTEGADKPKMMSVGLHCRLAGKPGRARAVAEFLDHALSHPDVWVCTREQIARHWHANHSAQQEAISA